MMIFKESLWLGSAWSVLKYKKVIGVPFGKEAAMKRSPVVQTQEEWEEEMAQKILRYTHDELFLSFRFLGIALSALEPREDKRIITLATDGSVLYFSKEQLIRVFKKNAAYLNRLYLHTILHCMFSHLWIGGKRERFLWGIACDIAVEYTIDHIDQKCTKRIIGWIRQRTYEALENNGTGISAAYIYRFLLEKEPEELQELHQEFFADDHVFWPKEEQKNIQAESARKNWDKIARQTQMEQQRRGRESDEGEELIAFQMKARKARRTYRDFLRKFAVLHEEMHCDLDEFDLNFYTYGLQFYRNMPLVESLESREIKKIRDFVVVVDTSYSTSGELVQGFLHETFEILSQEDNFFHQCRLHILQCDEEVKSDVVITRKEEIEALFSDFTIQGGGGTDFRPAFTYVEELLSDGELENLCGLLYFTDGKGIYPEKKPDFQTAFLFMEDYEEEKVPVWAIRMRLEREEFEGSLHDKKGGRES